jgi:methyl-accepting chemotaxis protein
MQKLSAAIEKIKQSSDATAKIVKTIDEIAFQTNLLALNAAVEAARAGDAGKGFAVVAEEVRNLAMRSAEAAKNTANLIEESVTNAGNGVSLNLQVATDLKNIHEQIRKVSEVMGEIAVASEQQNQAVEQINQAVEQVNTVTQQAAANSEESASAAEEMSGQAQELLSMVSSFRLTSVNGNVQRSLLKTRPATVAVAAGHGKKAEKPARAWTAKPAGNGNGKHPAANGQHLPGHLQTEKMIPFGDDHDTLAAF